MISELGITNFKTFASATFRLGRYTLLSGLNSSGKSTVLQALALLHQSKAISRDFNDFEGLRLNGELVELGTGQDVLSDDYAAVPGETPKIGLRLATQGGEVLSWRFSYGQEEDILSVSGNNTSVPDLSDNWTATGRAGDFSLFNPGFQYLRADRINPATTFPTSYEMSVRRGFLGTRGEFTIDYLLHFQDEPVQSEVLHISGAPPRLLAQVEAWMGEICPGVRVQAEAIERTDLARLGFQFAHPGRLISEQRRPTNVGFGLTYVLPVVVACLTAQPGAMLLIENPEAHIHPQGQSAMARLTCAAAAAGAQVIVETHSDHVLNGVRLSVKRGPLSAEDVVLQYFRRGAEGIEIVSPSIGSDGMLREWPSGFFDEWDRSLDQLLDS